MIKKYSLKKAKELFVSCDCSHSIMWREIGNNIERYRKLNIPKEVENEWRSEYLSELCELYNQSNIESEYIRVYHRITEIVWDLKTENAVALALKTSELKSDNFSMETSIAIAEAITGRKIKVARSGLIYLSYDLERFDIAQKFTVLAYSFAKRYKDSNRKTDLLLTIEEIAEELKLIIPADMKLNKYKIRFWFEHGGICFWGQNDKTKQEYSYAIETAKLPISAELIKGFNQLEEEYITYLDWDYPSNPSPWTERKKEDFIIRATTLYDKLVDELGDEYILINGVDDCVK